LCKSGSSPEDNHKIGYNTIMVQVSRFGARAQWEINDVHGRHEHVHAEITVAD